MYSIYVPIQAFWRLTEQLHYAQDHVLMIDISLAGNPHVIGSWGHVLYVHVATAWQRQGMLGVFQ